MRRQYIFLILTIQCLIFNPVYSQDDTPLFNGETLNIPTVDSINKPGEFQNVVLEATEQGTWQLLDYQIGHEIGEELHNIEIIKTDSFPIQVFLKISGTFFSGCLEVGQIRYRLVDNTFEVFVYFKHRLRDDELIICGQGFVPFSTIYPLPIYGLKAGEYNYSVNGTFVGGFNLDSDNILAQ